MVVELMTPTHSRRRQMDTYALSKRVLTRGIARLVSGIALRTVRPHGQRSRSEFHPPYVTLRPH